MGYRGRKGRLLPYDMGGAKSSPNPFFQAPCLEVKPRAEWKVRGKNDEMVVPKEPEIINKGFPMEYTIAFKLCKAGYGTPESILNMPVAMVLALLEYDTTISEYKQVYIEINS